MPFSSQIGKSINDLPTPCLVVSEKAYKNNCKNMIEKACQMGVQLRGQTKTHKTIEGAILQTGGTKRYDICISHTSRICILNIKYMRPNIHTRAHL